MAEPGAALSLGCRVGPLRRSAALEEFTELRWMTVQHDSRPYPI